MACNINFECNNVQPRSAFCFAVSLCPDSSSGTLHCITDFRQPIPKRSRCRGHIVISWMFTGVVKQALFAKIIGAPNDGIFPNASEVSEMCHSVLGKPV